MSKARKLIVLMIGLIAASVCGQAIAGRGTVKCPLAESQECVFVIFSQHSDGRVYGAQHIRLRGGESYSFPLDESKFACWEANRAPQDLDHCAHREIVRAE